MTKYIYNQDGSRNLQLILDNSSLDTFRRCPKKYEMSILQGWQGKEFEQATSFGHAFHSAMEHYDLEVFNGVSHHDALKGALRVGARSFAKVEPTTARNIENLWRAINWYFYEYGEKPLPPITFPDGSVAVEKRLEVPLVGGYNLSLRLDKITSLDGKLYIHDYKTTETTIGDFYFNKYATDSQVSAYCWALGKMGLQIEGFIIDAVQVAVGFNRFVRHIERREQWQLDEWYQDTIYWAKQLEECWNTKEYPRNTSSCYMCNMKGICSRAPHMRRIFLEEDFVQNLEVK